MANTVAKPEAPVALPGLPVAPVSPEALVSPRLSRSAWGWSLYEAGRDPYTILIVVYVFMPYFAAVMVGDPVRGQELVAEFAKVAGVILALTAPLLGAIIDRGGRRKPALLVITLLAAPLIASLWWAKPDGSGLSIMAVVVIAGALNVLLAWSNVVHNAMLVPAAGVQAGRASGVALALANVVGVVALAGVLWAFVLPGRVASDLLPDAPLFGLDPLSHEPDRVVAWVSAGLLLAGAIPLALHARDLPATGGRFIGNILPAMRDLVSMVRSLRHDRNMAIYLVAYMFAADGMGSVAMFLGIYAAGVMKWGVLQMLLFAIWQSVAAGLGGYAAGVLDGLIGPKRTLQTALAGGLVCTLGIIALSTQHVLIWPYDPETGWRLAFGGMSLNLPEVVFLICAGGSVFWLCAAASSGRTTLLLLTRPEQSGAYFGLFALSGKATAWLGPMLVAWFTAMFGSQQLGFVPVAALLMVGFVGLAFVKPRPLG